MLAPHTYSVDLFLALIYGGIWSFIFAFFFFQVYREKDKYWLLLGMFFNLYGGVLQGLIYDFFYKGGDNFEFAASASILYDIFWQDPSLYWQYFIAPFQDFLVKDEYFNTMVVFPHYWGNRAAFTTVVLTSLFMIPSFKMYYITCIHIALLDYWVSLLLYIELKRRYPKGYFLLLFGLFLAPPIWFWTSGILKDSYTFIGLALYVIALFKIQKGSFLQSFYWVLLGFVGAFLAYYIKPYVILSAIPITGIWISLNILKTQTNRLIKYLLAPYVLMTLFGVAMYLTYVYSRESPLYSIDKFIGTIEMKRRDLLADYYYGERLGSRYDIGEVTEDPLTLISKIPIALVTGYFRPFLFEVRNLLMFAASLETLLYLTIFLYVLFRIPFRIWMKAWSSSPDFLFFMTYSLFFTYWVTLSSGNFGNLVRYRVPGLAFFFIGLGILFHIKKLSEIESMEGIEMEREKIY